MGWYVLVGLALDGRVKFLLGFILVAVAIASALTFIEFKLKKKKVAHEEQSSEDLLIGYLDECFRSKETAKKKLEVLDHLVKVYFKDLFEFELNSSYSELINQFRMKGRQDLIKFCESIYSVHYFSENISGDKINELIDSFKKIIRSRVDSGDDIKNTHGFFRKILNSFGSSDSNFSNNLQLAKSKLISYRVESNVRKDLRAQKRISSLNNQVKTRVLKIQQKEEKKNLILEKKVEYANVREAYSAKRSVEKAQSKENRKRTLNHLKKGASLGFLNILKFFKKKKIRAQKNIVRRRKTKRKSSEQKRILREKNKVLQTKARKVDEMERAHLKHGILLKKLARKREKAQIKKKRRERSDEKRKEKKTLKLKRLARKNILRKRAAVARLEKKQLRDLEKSKKKDLRRKEKKRKLYEMKKATAIIDSRKRILKNELVYRAQQISREKKNIAEQKVIEKGARDKMKALLKKQRLSKDLESNSQSDLKIKQKVPLMGMAMGKIRRKNVVQNTFLNKKIEVVSGGEHEVAFKIAKQELKTFERFKKRDIKHKIRLAGIVKRKKISEDKKIIRVAEKADRLEKKSVAKILKDELLEVRKRALEKKKIDIKIQKDIEMKKEIQKGNLISNLRSEDVRNARLKRAGITQNYPIGSREWMNELDKNSRK